MPLLCYMPELHGKFLLKWLTHALAEEHGGIGLGLNCKLSTVALEDSSQASRSELALAVPLNCVPCTMHCQYIKQSVLSSKLFRYTGTMVMPGSYLADFSNEMRIAISRPPISLPKTQTEKHNSMPYRE